MARASLPRFWLVTHRWVGIAAAVLLVVIALSGAVLVYQPAVERALYPSLYRVAPGGARLPYDSLVAIATRASSRKVKAGGIIVPERDDVAARVQFGFRHVFVDPYRGTVLGERGIGESLVVKVRILHHSLLFEPYGITITLAVTIAGIFLTLGGLVLWWPRRIWRVTRTGTWRGVNFDLHNVVGVVSALGVLFFSATAVLLQLGPTLQPVYRRALGDAPEVRLAPASPRADTPLSIDSLVALGRGRVTGELREIVLPADPHGTLTLRHRAPDEHGQRARNLVWIDANDGRIRGTIDQTTRPMGTRVAMLMEDWHLGAFAPPWSQLFALLSCLMLAFQSISGPLIWWRPRKRRRVED